MTGVAKADSEYYGVFVPQEYRSEEESEASFVFHVREEALGCAKQYKKARFKAFFSYSDAVKFAQNGSEAPKPLENILIDPEVKQDPVALIGEKQSPFRAPKSQELVKFRKAIEIGDIDKVNSSIWDNPRYLVSSGDTPSILQEGSRYNALHVSAKAKNHEICDLILSTISQGSFIKLLYGDASYDEELAKDRIKVLLDLYLNTPDKGLNETPLHFAVKFGATEVVQVLLSYPQCDKTLRNKYGKTPDMIICDRCDEKDARKKKQISLLLEGSYYVPVLRAEDNTTIPVVGAPFCPGSPPILNENPLSPRLEIRAYAGPLNRKQADQFRRVWKTPPRCSSKNQNSPRDQAVVAMRYKDAEKGLERLGKNLASKYQIDWKEYWPFLDEFVDLSSEEGLQTFENYLASRVSERSDASRDISELANLLENCTLGDKSSPRVRSYCTLCATQSCPDGGDCLEMGQRYVEGCENNTVNPELCMEKACQVYATRLSNSITQSASRSIDEMAQILRKEIIQIHMLISSYLRDARFTSINFQSIHSRLGEMTSMRICDHAEYDEVVWIQDNLKSLKIRFSRDNKLNGSRDILTGINHEMIPASQTDSSTFTVITCLIDNILNGLKNIKFQTSEDQSLQTGNNSINCSCNLLSCITDKQFNRNNISYKRKPLFLDITPRQDCEHVFHENHGRVFSDTIAGNYNSHTKDNQEDDDTEDFFTPPSTPGRDGEDSEGEFEFEDAKTLREEIFIEGEQPTRTDCEVYDALIYSDCVPSVKDFPHVYKWYHAVSLYSNSERRSWQSCTDNKKRDWTPDRMDVNEKCMDKSFISTPQESSNESPRTPTRPVCSSFADGEFQTQQRQQLYQHTNSPRLKMSRSWFKVTGLNSPKTSLRRRLT